MTYCGRFYRRLEALAGVLCLLLATTSIATAKAQVFAVFPLRSTSELATTAAGISQELADRLAQAQGYDAQLVQNSSGNPADAAAGVGAEFYVTGQVLGDASGYRIILVTFGVASNHEISNITVTSKDGHLPAEVTVAAVLKSTGQMAQGASGPRKLVLVPFEEPNGKDVALEFATTEFIKKLAAKGVTVMQGTVMDHVQAATNVSAVCKQYGATGVLLGSVTHEQRPILFDGVPTTATINVSELDCDGKMLWHGSGSSNSVHQGANPAAAISLVVSNALDMIINQFGTGGSATSGPI
ncbi:MAG TPA: hypothetical protein VN905_12550 [Candidatus Binatia bacterium]|nr:hypothetical protein [Candidatus Binatia bacterium]